MRTLVLGLSALACTVAFVATTTASAAAEPRGQESGMGRRKVDASSIAAMAIVHTMDHFFWLASTTTVSVSARLLLLRVEGELSFGF